MVVMMIVTDGGGCDDYSDRRGGGCDDDSGSRRGGGCDDDSDRGGGVVVMMIVTEDSQGVPGCSGVCVASEAVSCNKIREDCSLGSRSLNWVLCNQFLWISGNHT